MSVTATETSSDNGCNRDPYDQEAKDDDEPRRRLDAQEDWRGRFNSLRNVPPIFRMVWESAPKIVASSLFCRLLAALLPVGMLVVTRRIIDAIYIVTSRHAPLSHGFWGLVALQFGMALPW